MNKVEPGITQRKESDMPLLFNDIYSMDVLEKNNPYHDPKTGRFTTRNGGGSFVPVDLNSEPPKDASFKEKMDAIRRIGGDLITVGGKDYSDMGSDAYNDYLEEHGTTSEHDMSEGTLEAYERADSHYVGTGESFRVNRWLRADQDSSKYVDNLVNEKSWWTGTATRDAERAKEEVPDTVAAMDKMISSDSLKQDMMLTRYVGPSCIRNISRAVAEAYENGASNQELVDLINKEAGMVVTEKGYLSASVTHEGNVFTDRPFRLALLTPEDTPAFITDNRFESEVVLGRDTSMSLVGAQEIEGENDRQIEIIYQVLGDVKKSSVRTPDMLMVEPAADSETERKKIIRQMMGFDDGDEIRKYNHNHDADGRFCSAGDGINIDPTGSASRKEKVSKLTGQAMRNYRKEISADVTQTKEFREANRRAEEDFKAMKEARDAASAALKAQKPKPKEDWDSEDELRSLMGIRPMTGEKEWKEAYEREQETLKRWHESSGQVRKLMVDAEKGGIKTNDDLPNPKRAEKSEYPGFRNETGVGFYDDAENLKYHGLKGEVTEMSPVEYLERCAANFNSAKEDPSERHSTLTGQVLQLNSNTVEKLQLLMENGTKLDMPYLNVGLNDGAQEGRHRAMAAYNLGMDRIPVLYVSALSEEVSKNNPYHGKDGRFTFAPGGMHNSDINVSRETHLNASEWSDHLKKERESLSGKKQSEKALYANDHYIASQDDCIRAMQEGKADELLDDYFRIMEQNGDPKPSKRTAGQISIMQEGKEIGYTEARRKHIREDTGCGPGMDETYRETLEKYFSSYIDTDEEKKIIDDYVSKAPAYDGIIYRGIAWDQGNGGYEEFMKNVHQGSELDMRGEISSWSSNEEVSRNFAHHGDNNADSVMLVCVGNRTAVPVDHLSMMGESEVLAGSEAKWTVLYSETATWDSGARKSWIYVIEKGERT